jgi:hypothetical protein
MNLIKQSLHKLCIHQPDNPIHFLKQYFSGEQYDQVRYDCLIIQSPSSANIELSYIEIDLELRVFIIDVYVITGQAT